MTRVIACSTERTYHFDTQWASSVTIAHTRLNTRGFSRIFGMGQSFWRREFKDGTCNATGSDKKFFVHNAALSWTTEANHSLNITFPQIPDLMYHQSNNDGTTSLPKTVSCPHPFTAQGCATTMGSISEGPNWLLEKGANVWTKDVVQSVGVWLREPTAKDWPPYAKREKQVSKKKASVWKL